MIGLGGEHITCEGVFVIHTGCLLEALASRLLLVSVHWELVSSVRRIERLVSGV